MKKTVYTTIVLAFAALAPWAACAVAQHPKPNILLIVSDDQSYPYLGCYGEPAIKTPNLDQLAAAGMKFHRMFITSPQCSPSRGSLMTGKSPVGCQMSRFGSPLPAREVTFPELLRKDAGYFTGILGRWHHLDGHGLDRSDPETFKKYHLGTTPGRLDFVDASIQDRIPALMKQFFDRRPKDKPYFLQVNLNDPHLPWTTGKNPPKPKDVRVPKFLPDLPEVRRDLSAYMGECQHADGIVKNVLEIVQKRAGLKNTLILYFGDNGMSFPHGKTSLYDPGLNVPLLARWDGVIKPGGDSRALISGEDIAPTCLEAAGLKTPPSMSGVSFLPLLRGQPFLKERKYIFGWRAIHYVLPYNGKETSNQVDFSRCVRSARYKLIMNVTPEKPFRPDSDKTWVAMCEAHKKGQLPERFVKAYFSPRPAYELYDLESDPDELHNLYGTEAMEPIARELKAALRERMIIDNDYLPLPKP